MRNSFPGTKSVNRLELPSQCHVQAGIPTSLAGVWKWDVRLLKHENGKWVCQCMFLDLCCCSTTTWESSGRRIRTCLAILCCCTDRNESNGLSPPVKVRWFSLIVTAQDFLLDKSFHKPFPISRTSECSESHVLLLLLHIAKELNSQSTNRLLNC